MLVNKCVIVVTHSTQIAEETGRSFTMYLETDRMILREFTMDCLRLYNRQQPFHLATRNKKAFTVKGLNGSVNLINRFDVFGVHHICHMTTEETITSLFHFV